MKLSDMRAKGYDLTLVDEGHEKTYRTARGAKNTVQIDRVWRVLKDGEIIGTIVYEMITRETRSKGRMYVNRRWESPGYRWTLGTKRYGWRSEAYSRSDAIEKIIRDHERS